MHPVPDPPPIHEIREYLGRASHQVPCLSSAFWHRVILFWRAEPRELLMLPCFPCFISSWIQVSATTLSLNSSCPHIHFTNRLQTLWFFLPFLFLQLIFIWKAITGVWQLELLLKCPCVTLTRWHLFCNLWWFYCMYFQEDHIVTIKLCHQIFSFPASRIGYDWDMNVEEGDYMNVLMSKSSGSVQGGERLTVALVRFGPKS